MPVHKPKRGAVGRHTKLNHALLAHIIRLIERGATDSAAISAAGIAPSSYYLWKARGEQEPSGIYHDFLIAVMIARAHAIADAESRIYIEDPLAWLTCGPGRERPGRPGWSKRGSVLSNTQGHPSERVALVTVWGASGDNMLPGRSVEI